MRAIIAVVALAVSAHVSTTFAAEADRRPCVLQSLQRMPAGFSAGSEQPRFDDEPVPVVTARIVGAVGASDAAEFFDPTFHILDDRLDQTIKSQTARGHSAEARAAVIEAVIPKMRAAYRVSVSGIIAGQPAEFQSLCLVSQYDTRMVVPLGLH